MKFNKGYWQLQDGVTPVYAVRVHETELSDDAMVVYLSSSPQGERGDLLQGAVITVRFTSPMPGVIRVQAQHFKGRQPIKPCFDFDSQQKAPATRSEQDEDALCFNSGPLTVRMNKAVSQSFEFLADGLALTSSQPKSLALMHQNGRTYFRDRLALGVGETIYGFGERFGPFVKNGQAVESWNEDGGTSYELAYKNVPFYLSSRGYGILVNHPERVSFEVASEHVNSVQFSVEGHLLDYYVIYGPTPVEVLERYTGLTGRPALPPAWSFGLWLTTSFVTDYDEKTVTSNVQGMADRNIPLHVFHFDCFWMRGYHWCDFEWDPECFPDPPAMLKRLKERGLKICVWLNPYIGERSTLFEEGMQNGYLLKTPSGDVYQIDQWQPGMGLVDFTNPAAAKWYADKLRGLLDMGVDAFKTDFAERIPTEVVYHDGSDPQRMHNYYTYLYNRTVFQVLEERFGKNEAVVFARSATVGGQKFPVHWGGDCNATFESMAESLRGGLSLGMSGFGFWSHDIGGFEHTATPTLYKRWVAFGLLSSHSRLHGNSSSRVPWLFDEESVDVLRFFTRQKCQLMPYLYRAAIEATTAGTPVMRSMLLAFPSEPACRYLDRQYMLGPSLLVAPVFSETGDVEYYLPPGRWTNYLTDEVADGGVWRREKLDFLSIPLWVKENAVLPVGANTERPDYNYTDGLTLHIFNLQDGANVQVEVPDTDGKIVTRFNCSRTGKTLRIARTGAPGAWSVQLRGATAVAAIPARSDEIEIDLGS